MSDREVVGFCLPDEEKRLLFAPPEESRSVIGIDFGTSNSAAAFSMTDGGDDVFPVIDGGQGETKETTTVTIENTAPYRAVAFGRQALNVFDENKHLLFHRFKMQLYDDPKRQFLQPSAGGDKNTQVPTKIVIARALELLAQQALQRIYDKEGIKPEEQDEFKQEVIWVLTLPAIWADDAKLTMRQAALEAKLIQEVTSEKLILALEPECAAINIRESQEDGIGTRYLILDCGGGTIDTVAFEIAEDPDSKEFVLKGLLSPSGGDWGSTRIDRKFEEFLNELFQGRLNIDVKTRYEFMSQVWELAKMMFGSADPRPTSLNLNMITLLTDDINIKELVTAYNQNHPELTTKLKPNGRSRLRVPAELVEGFFSQVLREIRDHVRSLIRQVDDLTKVVLVGGFAQSTFLQEAVESVCDDENVPLIVASQPSLSIVIGAVKFGLNPMTIVSRIINSTVGVAYSTSHQNFISQFPTVEPGDHKYFDENKNQDRVTNLFDVFFRPGQEVKINEPVEKTYYPVYDTQTRITFKLMRTSESEVIFIDEDGCKKMTTVSIYVGSEGTANDRPVKVRMYFSLTELVVLFQAPGTHELKRATLTFEDGDTLIQTNN